MISTNPLRHFSGARSFPPYGSSLWSPPILRPDAQNPLLRIEAVRLADKGLLPYTPVWHPHPLCSHRGLFLLILE